MTIRLVVALALGLAACVCGAPGGWANGLSGREGTVLHAGSNLPRRLAGLDAPFDPHDVRAPLGVLLAEGAVRLAPFSHVVFCMHNPGECTKVGNSTRVQMTTERWFDVIRINKGVNRSIRGTPSSRDGTWGIDVSRGDCNDYAVTKRSHLIAAGLPSGAVVLAVALTEQGLGHLLVVLRTEEGDFVLDNRSDEIKAWYETPYRWLSVQSVMDPNIWKTAVAKR